jgi:thiamine-monophosphate kinase
VNEDKLVKAFAKIFANPSPALLVGIGDDGAVTKASAAKQVYVTDVAVENIHFKWEWSTPAQIGGRIVVANLADLFAMGALPKYLLATMVVPPWMSDEMVIAVAKGMKKEADRAGAIIIGGDLSSGELLSISITGIGELKTSKPLLRSGAKPGDSLYLSGAVGGSLMGHFMIELGATSKYIEGFKNTFLLPQPNYQLMKKAFSKRINAAIDISDGLVSEARRIAKASNVSVELDLTDLRAAKEFEIMMEVMKITDLKISDFDAMLLDSGEEHQLLISTKDPMPGWIKVGQVVKNKGGRSQIFLNNKAIKDAEYPGYRHGE